MRHQYSGRKFSRTSAHRKAMFQNMTVSLVEHELIKTTLPKAKELRRYAEPLITLAKQDSVANRRLAFDRLRDKAAVGKLFNELGPRFEARPGGYLRILKCGFRTGDKAPMAYVELVGRDGAEEAVKPAHEAAPAVSAPAEEAVVEEVAEEVVEQEAEAVEETVEEEAAAEEAPVAEEAASEDEDKAESK